MTKLLQLNSDERHFLELVSQAVMTNPFSSERARLDLRIGGLFPGIPETKQVDRAIAEVHGRIAGLEQKGLGHLSACGEKDRIVLRNAFLFDFFHQFVEQFDKHILDQIQAGATPLKVEFARKALALLKRREFSDEDCLRYFAMSFQLRRAFYFINQGLVGRSASMCRLREKLWNNVFTLDINLYNEHLWNRMEDFATLILGETGTGKGTAAMAIGRSGYIPFDLQKDRFVESFTQSFISLNLSQFPQALIESELFGHQKGAFTGAVNDHQGIFQQCSPHGAIFLDEIGEVAIPVQIKLLKVLEERSYCPVGSHKENRFQGRIIAATNRELKDLRSNNILREDFFYRLCSDIIVVPPLRRRIAEDPAELDDLLEFTVAKIVGRPSPDLCRMVRSVIRQQPGDGYSWPGNVRELGQCVRRILLNREYNPFPEEAAEGPGANVMDARGPTLELDAQSLLKQYCHQLYLKYGTFGEVARCTRLDRRTVKKYIAEWQNRMACG